jgi:hypothetical protein
VILYEMIFAAGTDIPNILSVNALSFMRDFPSSACSILNLLGHTAVLISPRLAYPS